MRVMHHWFPDPTQNLCVQKQVINRMLTGLEELQLVAGYESPIRPVLERTLLQHPDQAAFLFHPIFFNWYFNLAYAALSENLHEVLRQLDQVGDILQRCSASWRRAWENTKAIGCSIDLDLDPVQQSAATTHLDDCISSLLKPLGETATPVSMAVPDDTYRAHVADAFAIVEDVWPEMHRELIANVRQVALVDSNQFLGATDVTALGCLFISRANAQNTVQLAEELVHEGSHVALNAAAWLDPICRETTSLLNSPLRSDPRPLFGVFHQVFVLTRLTEFYRRLVVRRSGFHDKLSDVETRWTCGVDLIAANKDLEPLGHTLLLSILDYRQHLKEKLQ